MQGVIALYAVVCAFFAFANAKHSYYLPGVQPHTFVQRDPVSLFVNKLTSTKTQMPFDYYSLPYCKPKRANMQSPINLGEVLSGDRVEDSVYKMDFKVPKSCEIACLKHLSKKERSKFITAVDEDYRVHWMLDSLPVGMLDRAVGAKGEQFSRGFPVGFVSDEAANVKEKKRYLFNHIRIIVKYHDAEEGQLGSKIVGFRVEPMSIQHKWEGDQDTVTSNTVIATCNDMHVPKSQTSYSDRRPTGFDYQQVHRGTETVLFTYDIFWEKSDVEWIRRWDIYLSANSTNLRVHWFSISNSVLVVLFLTTVIGMILLRALRRDIAQYNDPANLEDAKEESGWKLVHGDVFRPPQTQPMLFSVFVGTGLQLLTMCFSTLTFALLGLLSPANRGSLITAFILLFVFMGSFAGYYSSVQYKMFRGLQWQVNTLMTAFFYPGIVFSIIGVLNLLLSLEGSSGAIPFTSLFTLLFLWFCVSVPLVFLGSYYGYRRETVTFPVRTNQIPRAIPEQSWYMHPVLGWMVGGILPFGAVSVELYFIMSALWLHHIYYIFGFLFVVLIVLVLTCAEVSMLLTYLQLCTEDYRWWWNSFLSSGSCAGYIMLYAIWYNITELELDGVVPLFVYFCYMSIISFTFFLLTGTIGYIASFWFNCQIYGSIKVD
jgi:transmembrane 9 superfamily protein 2/4